MAADHFDRTKADILADLGVVDYSPKGSVDKEIVPLINLVNAHADLVTTSSCAGRVSVFIEGDKRPVNDKMKVGGKGLGGHWLFFTHDALELTASWRNGLGAYRHCETVDPEAPRRYVLYKFEPFILHVKCRNHETARRLFSLALFCGFRESGIGSNDNVAIRISMRIDAPIGYLKGDRIHQLATPEYLQELDSMALELFEKNSRRIDQLTEHISHFESSPPPQKKWEDPESRKQRLRKLGLQRQQELRDSSQSGGAKQSSDPSDAIDDLSQLF